MSDIEKCFDSIEEHQQWLGFLRFQAGQPVKATIISAETRKTSVTQRPKVKFSDTILCGLRRDRKDLQDVER